MQTMRDKRFFKLVELGGKRADFAILNVERIGLIRDDLSEV